MAEDSTHTAISYAVIATNSVTVDLTTHAQSPGQSTRQGRPCRSIIVHKAGTGTLAVTKKNGSQQTWTGLVSGQVIPAQAKKILPASAFSEITVLW